MSCSERRLMSGVDDSDSDQRELQPAAFPAASHLYHLNLAAPEMAENPGEQMTTYMETAQSLPDHGERDSHAFKSKKNDSVESPRKRQRSKAMQEGCQSDGYRVKSDSSSPGRSGKHSSKKGIQDGKSGIGRSGEAPRSDSSAMGLLSSPTPSHGSHEGSDVGFRSSLLDEVLTEKKLALLKSPGVKAFLQQQQAQAAAAKVANSKLY